MQLEQGRRNSKSPEELFHFLVCLLIGIAVWTELNFLIQQEAGYRL